jgi:hypothetical protein
MSQQQAITYFAAWLAWWKSPGELDEEEPAVPAGLDRYWAAKFKSAAHLVAGVVERGV